MENSHCVMETKLKRFCEFECFATAESLPETRKTPARDIVFLRTNTVCDSDPNFENKQSDKKMAFDDGQ